MLAIINSSDKNELHISNTSISSKHEIRQTRIKLYCLMEGPRKKLSDKQIKRIHIFSINLTPSISGN